MGIFEGFAFYLGTAYSLFGILINNDTSNTLQKLYVWEKSWSWGWLATRLLYARRATYESHEGIGRISSNMNW